MGVKALNYRGDNGVYKSAYFKQGIEKQNQTMSLSGVGTYRQNGVA